MDKDFGAYELKDRIGKGGMAWVYLANQKNLDRPVALKILFPHLAEDEKLVARFQLEAKSAAHLKHENICQVYDFGRHGEQFYIAMEYVEGKNLREWIDTHGTPPIEIALLMLRDICRGLEHAHRRTIIHRDIKPSNVMFTPDGVIKLMDFGLARRAEDTTGITMVGSMLGTPAYMSPEQARGEKLDRATTDIFSLGIVCYELLGGSRPFQGDTSSIARAIMYSEPRPLDVLDPLVPPGVESMIRRMLEKDAGKRVQTVTEVRQAFDLGVDQLGVREDRVLLADYAVEPERVGGALRTRRLTGHLEAVRAAQASGDEVALLRAYRCVAFLDPSDRAAREYVKHHEVASWPADIDAGLEHTVVVENPTRVMPAEGNPAKAGAPVPPAPPEPAPTPVPPAAEDPLGTVVMPAEPKPKPTPPAPPAAEDPLGTVVMPAGHPANPGPASKASATPPPPAFDPTVTPVMRKDAPPTRARAAPPASQPEAAGKAVMPSGKAPKEPRSAAPPKSAPVPKPAPPPRTPAGAAAKRGGLSPALIGIGVVVLLAIVGLLVWQPWKPKSAALPPEPIAQEPPSPPVIPEPEGSEVIVEAVAVLNVVASPEGAMVSLDGGTYVPSPARFADLEPRDYTVRIRRDSFLVARRVVPLAAGRETTLTVALRPATGAQKVLAALVVRTTPEGATVRLDGEKSLPSPARFTAVSEGEHTIEVRREGYEPRTLPFVARAGAETTLTVTLAAERRAPVATRTVNVKAPRGAQISLDGSAPRKDRLRFEAVPAGSHFLRATLAGHQDLELSFGLSGRRDTTLNLKLVPSAAGAGPTATIVLWSIPAGDFFVEGEAKGTRLDSVRVTVPADRDRGVTIRQTDPWLNATAKRVVRLKPGEVRYVGYDGRVDAAELVVDTPGRPGAEVLIDGKKTGRNTPARLYVNEGQHKVHVVGKTREGEQTIRFKAHQPKAVNFTLEP